MQQPRNSSREVSVPYSGRIRDADWAPVTGLNFSAVLASVLLLAVFFHRSEEDFLPVLDHVNPAFHEAGHIFFRPFGQWTGILGGTLGQLLMPVFAMGSFWRSGRTASFAIAGIWFFENLLNIARYVADARARELPLVGGGDHDWTNLLFHWDLLHQDVAVAQWITTIAWMGMFATLCWLFYRWQFADQR